MSKLLYAGIIRYTKSAFFWVAMVMSVIVGVSSRRISINACIIFELLLLAALFSLSVGREYSDGGFRNKLIAGHTKGTVFFSEILLSVSVCMILYIAAAIPAVIIKHEYFTQIYPMRYEDMSGIWYLFKAFLGVGLVHVCVVVICIFISMLISQKATASVINIFLIIALYFVASEVNMALINSQYVYIPTDTYEAQPFEEGGAYEEPENGEDGYIRHDNPNYISGAKRVIYEIVCNVLPEGQAIRYYYICPDIAYNSYYDEVSNRSMSVGESEEIMSAIDHMPLYSLGVIIVFTVAGYALFRKKDLK